MKFKRSYLLIISMILSSSLFLTGCSANGNNTGFFHTYMVEPFSKSLHILAELFSGSYGLAIIALTLIIRLLLLPIMLKQYKSQQIMKVKMDRLKPELDVIQKQLKATKDPKEQQRLQQEMFGLYKKHGVNPLSMGCLPILIQTPILMSFYYAIRGSHEIATHSFLWFSLGKPDIIITILAGIIYFFQFKVSQATMPLQQQEQMKYMGLVSPIMIVMVSFNAPSALPLYWTIGGTFLTIQTLLAQRMYKKHPLIVNSTEEK